MTPEECYKEWEQHDCDSPTDVCQHMFEYNCPDCGKLVKIVGESIPSNEEHGWECNHCYAYGPPVKGND